MKKNKGSVSVKELDKATLKLVSAALKAKENAYAPYSTYHVGCALLDSAGEVHTGCNVENASYPAGICAERTAIVKMVSSGGKKIKTIVVAASSEEPVFPCGMCLQVIQEFGATARVIALNARGTDYQEREFPSLFPFAFSPEKLEK